LKAKNPPIARGIQSADKVCTLNQTERNAGRFGDFFLVGIVAYGRGKNSPKADVAGILPAFSMSDDFIKK